MVVVSGAIAIGYSLVAIGGTVMAAAGLATGSLFVLGAVGFGTVALGAAALRSLTPKPSVGGIGALPWLSNYSYAQH